MSSINFFVYCSNSTFSKPSIPSFNSCHQCTHRMTNGNDDTKITLPTLWAIGVGAAIGGDFFGWQFILYGGFYGALLSVFVAAVFFWLYGNAITELAARYKTSGGAFDFARNAYGNRYGSIVVTFVLLKLILANCATCLAISSYLVALGMPHRFFCSYNEKLVLIVKLQISSILLVYSVRIVYHFRLHRYLFVPIKSIYQSH